MKNRIKFKKYRIIGSTNIAFAKLIPSIITLIGLGIGLSAIRFALNERWEMAVLCILGAAIVDGIDGRVARMLNATTSFGAELDSLCDFVNFGVAPSMVVYLWSLQDLKAKLIGWSVVLFFAMAMVIRLARFNDTSKNPVYGDFYKKFFLGIPAPCGGILILIPLILSFDIAEDWEFDIRSMKAYIAIYAVLIGILVASRIPTFSLKSFKIKQENVWMVLVFCAVTIATTIIYPWHVLPILSLCYLGLVPISFVHARKQISLNATTDKKNVEHIATYDKL